MNSDSSDEDYNSEEYDEENDEILEMLQRANENKDVNKRDIDLMKI
jgi:hypothetical protein